MLLFKEISAIWLLHRTALPHLKALLRCSVIVSGLSRPFTVAVVVAFECQPFSFMALYFHGWISGEKLSCGSCSLASCGQRSRTKCLHCSSFVSAINLTVKGH